MAVANSPNHYGYFAGLVSGLSPLVTTYAQDNIDYRTASPWRITVHRSACRQLSAAGFHVSLTYRRNLLLRQQQTDMMADKFMQFRIIEFVALYGNPQTKWYRRISLDPV
jgi:hypothetical protein